LAVLAALWLGGCVTLGEFGGGSSGGRAATKDSENFYDFMDVPFPHALTVETKNSFTYMRRGLLSGVVTAVGAMPVEELAAWFDAHLPAHGWQPAAEAQNVKIVSTWRKGQAVLTVVISPVTLSLAGDTRLELWVAPPHVQADLGKRTIYDSVEKSEPYSTKPIRTKKSGSVTEEDL
jgi:hypothetical protein